MAKTQAKQQFKIGLDCRLGGHTHAGIGRYISSIATRLPKQFPEAHFYYFCYDLKQADELIGNADFKNVTVIITPVKHYSVAEQLRLPNIFAQYKLNLLHVPHFNAPLFYSGQLIITIHDLLWHDHIGTTVTTLPKWQYWLKYLGYKLVASRAIYKAASILVPTHSVKTTVSSFYPSSTSKLVVTSEGVDPDWFVKSKTKRSKQQLLYVGSLYPHKNIRLVLKALQQLPGYQLVLVGSRNAFQDQVKKEVDRLQLSKQVSFAGYLTDTALRQKLQTSSALLQPSLSEGFGLTGLEAMATGTQVIASNIPVFKEVYGNFAHFFNPNSVTSLVNTITNLVPKSPRSLQAHAATFSWDTATQQIVEQYRTTLAALERDKLSK